MSCYRPRATGLLALLAVLVLAPNAGAAAPFDAASDGAKAAKERAFGKHCGSARKAPVHSGERAKCIDALSKLATGKSSSPRKACRGLSRKKAKGSRMSAYTRCVKAGAKIVRSKGGRRGGGNAGADGGDHPNVDGGHGSDGTVRADGADGAVGADGEDGPMGEPGDDWDPGSEPADDNDPDPALDIHLPNSFGGPRA